jgi:hypothetical protein
MRKVESHASSRTVSGASQREDGRLSRAMRLAAVSLAAFAMCTAALLGAAPASTATVTGSDYPAPAFTIEKLQKIDGSSSSFTSGPLSGKVGQTVDYQIVVKNTSQTGAQCDLSGGDEKEAPGDEKNSGDAENSAPFSSDTGSCSCEGSESDSLLGVDSSRGVPCGCERSEGESSSALAAGLGSPASDGCEADATAFKSQSEGDQRQPDRSEEDRGEGGQTKEDGEVASEQSDGGNTPLSFAALKDTGCEGIAGGPAKALNPGESATFTCHHTLTAAGSYENTASITASPPEGEGSPVTRSSNTVVAGVAYEPALTIEILQKVHGSSRSFTRDSLSANVGDTVDYLILVKNAGNAAMEVTSFKDSGCDLGSVSGGPGAGPIVPGTATTYLCRHVVAASDQKAGSYPNSVTITGSSGEANSVTTALSNTVLVALAPTPSAPAPAPYPAPPGPQPQAPPQAAVQHASVRASSAAFRAAAASGPGLNGPSGCVRASFIASLNAAGVRSVSFSLDGHRVRTLAANSARGGWLSLRIRVNGLAVGVHRLLAQIAMQGAPPTSRTARTLTFLRCGPAVVAPKFTG